MLGNARPVNGDSDGMIRRDPVPLEGCWRKKQRSVRRLSMGSVSRAREASSSMGRAAKSWRLRIVRMGITPLVLNVDPGLTLCIIHVDLASK